MTHLWPSVLVLAVIAALIVFAWYPHPFLQFGDNQKFSLLLIGIAVWRYIGDSVGVGDSVGAVGRDKLTGRRPDRN